jgi:hypothetical protein
MVWVLREWWADVSWLFPSHGLFSSLPWTSSSASSRRSSGHVVALLTGFDGLRHLREPGIVELREFRHLLGHLFGEIVGLRHILAQIKETQLVLLAHELPIAGTHRPPAFVAAGAPEEGHATEAWFRLSAAAAD